MFSRTSRILLVIALLAAGAYLWIERPRERRAAQREEHSDQLASFAIASIDSIVIVRPQDTLSFARSDSLWRMHAPLSDAAEPGAIGRLLDALRTADIDRNLGAERDLSPYGLDHPDAVITLASASGRVLHVAVGKNTVDNAWCYARTTTGDVLLVPTDVRQSSTLPVDAYRDRRVLAFQVRDVSAYEIRVAKSGMKWIRSGEAWYALAGRDTVPGDSVAVPSPLHRLRGLRAASFPAPGDTVGELSDTNRVITLWTAPARHVTLRFTRTGTSWLVRDAGDGRMVTVDDDLTDLFAHTVNDLRDRRLLQFDPAVTQRINYAAPTATGEIVRAGGNWSFPNPLMGHVNARYAADFVRALRNLKWSRPGDEAARTTGRVSYRIEIVGERDKMIDQLTAGPYDATTSWVTSRSSRGTWLVENARLDEVSKVFTRLKER